MDKNLQLFHKYYEFSKWLKFIGFLFPFIQPFYKIIDGKEFLEHVFYIENYILAI